MSKPIAVVTINSDHAEVVTPTVTKIVSLPTVSELINTLISQPEESDTAEVKTTILPRNTLLYGRSKSTIKILTYHPGHMAMMTHTARSEPFKVPMPNIIVVYTLRVSASGSSADVTGVIHYATNKSPIAISQLGFNIHRDRRNGIWNLPLPNIFSGGDPCYGHNVMPRDTSLDNMSGLNWYYDYLEATPNNNDLSIPEVNPDEAPAYASPYLEFLEKGNYTEYPYEILHR